MKHHDIGSQAKLIPITGVSQTQIGNILRGDKAASIDVLERLANGLNCEPWRFLAPVNLSGNLEQTDFTPLIYCYSRLHSQDQNAVWDMTHDLYEAMNGFYTQGSQILEHF